MSLCPADQITIQDPLTGAHQCEQCRKCNPGEGLSVKCGDVIDTTTPISCKPCVLGQTYSASYEPGACRDCGNCEAEFRETKKACTLTSPAVCGDCIAEYYPDGLIGFCQPCSYCCNDNADIKPSQCNLPALPKNKRCSIYRAEKCEKVAQRSNTPHTTTVPMLDVTQPEIAGNTTVSPPERKENMTSPTGSGVQTLSASSFPYPALAAIVPLMVLIICVLIYCYKKQQKAKRRSVTGDAKFTKVSGIDPETGRNEDEEEETGGGADDADEVRSLPVAEIEDSDTDLASGSEDDTLSTHLGVEETESPLPKGIMESQPPGSYDTDTTVSSAAQLRVNQTAPDNHSNPKPTTNAHAQVKLSAVININGNSAAPEMKCSCQQF